MGLDNTILLDKDTKFEGEVVGGHLILEGKIKGVVKVEGRVYLKKGAHLNGDVFARNFNMTEGAFFHGNLVIEPEYSPFVDKKESETEEKEAVKDKEPERSLAYSHTH